MGRFLTGITTGAIVGAAVGMIMMPRLDRKTQRNIRRMGKRVMHVAEDTYGNVIDRMR
ncbi:hypothetical protein CPJCM30710_01630 [Clostridium polyendosporum]|uniref:YtxH-like protein n=1 Tax=Clostridium polyendosporum TaxID=69208 RepID=A0A919VEV4_9CLOT|nr:hypothetical protein [Clostridium polyendosporum]GIM27497.1 hypothetical protein CPJCM30710_01630 [Clostridium polyendosporum]